jgi:hypothetical protein
LFTENRPSLTLNDGPLSRAKLFLTADGSPALAFFGKDGKPYATVNKSSTELLLTSVPQLYCECCMEPAPVRKEWRKRGQHPNDRCRQGRHGMSASDSVTFGRAHLSSGTSHLPASSTWPKSSLREAASIRPPRSMPILREPAPTVRWTWREMCRSGRVASGVLRISTI